MGTPIFTQSMNGMLTGDYTRSDLRKIATAQRPLVAKPTYAMAFDIVPARGDLQEIQSYLTAQEATDRWRKEANYGYSKTKTTDDLMRTFLTQMIESETARRSEIEAAEDMPFAGVVAKNIERKRRVGEAVPSAALAAAPPVAPMPARQPALARMREILLQRGGLDSLRRMAPGSLTPASAAGSALRTPSPAPLSPAERRDDTPADDAAAASVKKVFTQSKMGDYFGGGGSGAKAKGPDRTDSRWNSSPATGGSPVLAAAAAAEAPAGRPSRRGRRTVGN